MAGSKGQRGGAGGRGHGLAVAVAIAAGLGALALSLASGSGDGGGDGGAGARPVPAAPADSPAKRVEPRDGADNATAWRRLVTEALPKDVEINVAASAGRVTLDGEAVDAATGERLFADARRALQRASQTGDGPVVLAGELRLKDGGRLQRMEAAAFLPDAPDTAACQRAFDAVLEGQSIRFTPGRALIAAESRPLLDALAAIARTCSGHKVSIAGHTDTAGDAVANQSLSERRAQAVADYLVTRDVAAGQLGVAGFGETRPVDRRGGAAADARNRRIEFKVDSAPPPEADRDNGAG